jgi:transposase InsO family protein
MLIKRCLIDRQVLNGDFDLIVHSDQGKQFQSDEFRLFCEQYTLKRSITRVPRGNQVIESLNNVIKSYIRLRVDPAAKEFKKGSWADPI